MPNKFGWLIITAAFALADESASAQQGYQSPPAPIADILAAPPPPSASLSPTRDRLALVTTERYPSVAQLAEPTLKLAGVKVNPRTNGRARETKITGVTFLTLSDRKEAPLVIDGPPLAGLHGLAWCPDGRHFSILNSTPAGTRLYLGDAATGKAALVPNLLVGGVFGGADWADADSIFVWSVPAGRGAEPAAPPMPAGPVVQEAKGKAAPVRTYQDLLTNRHDEELFRHYATAQLALLNRTTLVATPIGTPGIITAADRSPDGKYALVTRLDEPFSYLYPWSSFPKSVEVFDAATGAKVATVAKLPLQDTVPIEGVPTGPRSIRWLSAEPASLGYAQALDGGDPRAKVPFRDELFRLRAPFAQAAEPLLKVEHRFAGMSFTDTGLAMISDYDRERRWTRTVQLDLAKPDAKTVVFDRSAQDRYGDPGSPLGRQLPNGQTAIRTANGKLWLSAGGATPKGERPFLSLYDPATREATRVFECRAGFYETAAPLSDDGKTLLIRRESQSLPPNYFLRTPDGAEVALTKNADPFPQLRQVKKQLVSTKRSDGVTISFTLYTPPNYVEGTPLPTVFWAYPQEFNSADNAGQVSGSPDRFVTLAGYSHLFFLTQGYAVMDDVSVPIVGPPETANDTFVTQLVESAKAAIDKAVEMGVVDRSRVGVGGHSYGAFMTANFLAHSDLFRAGIARSGAYNRTLTPFGFQNERRTFWEAPEVYAKMSPFNAADKINEPLLLIHGQSDSNPGTFPVQSERLYQAIRGTGGNVRLVLLPHEDHGYAGRESILHVLAESVAWFDQYVKNAPARSRSGGGGE